MMDFTPDYNAYFVFFYSTVFDDYNMPITNRKSCVVLAEDEESAEEIAEFTVDKLYPHCCNSGFIASKMDFHDISPIVDTEDGVMHYRSDKKALM